MKYWHNWKFGEMKLVQRVEQIKELVKVWWVVEIQSQFIRYRQHDFGNKFSLIYLMLVFFLFQNNLAQLKKELINMKAPLGLEDLNNLQIVSSPSPEKQQQQGTSGAATPTASSVETTTPTAKQEEPEEDQNKNKPEDEKMCVDV